MVQLKFDVIHSCDNDSENVSKYEVSEHRCTKRKLEFCASLH